MNINYIFLAINCFIYSIYGQSEYPKDFFSSPINMKIAIAGTFGELRNNHFHSGIDIKTKQKKNIPIYAAQDGFVSRIKISTHGFGKALYIDHEHGFTTVYAHLEKFNNTIQKESENIQYEKESFEIDVSMKKDQIKVSKGELIGFSGNTGSSTAPHLHFEIRDTKTQKIINPMLFGLPILDRTKPIIKSILFYHGDNRKERIPTKEIKPGVYELEKKIETQTPFNIGIHTYDLLDAAPNKNGIYSIELYVNDSLFFYNKMSSFSFHETRYINSHIDYAYYKNHNIKFQKCFLDLNNKISTNQIYNKQPIGTFLKNGTHKIHIIIKDTYGNKSNIKFDVELIKTNTKTISEEKKMINANQVFEFNTKKCEIYIPNNSLYKNYPFIYKEKTDPLMPYPIYQILHDSIPSHKKFIISIKTDSLPKKFRQKALIARIENNKAYYINSKWENHQIIGKSNKFGDFTVLIDSIKPVIEYNNTVTQNRIQFNIYDELSGIKEYRGEINGKWILMEYDFKTNSLHHNFTENPKNTKQTLTLFVSDLVGNTNTLTTHFFR